MKIEKSSISTVQRGRIVGANFIRTRQIRQTPTTPEIACPPGFFQNWNWFLMILVVQIYWVDVLMDILKLLMRAYTAWSGVDVQRLSHLECSRFSLQSLQLSVNSIQEQNSTLPFWNQWTSPPGTYTTLYCEELDKQRIYHAERKSGDKFKKRRKQLRKQRKGIEDTNTQKGVTYKSGVF